MTPQELKNSILQRAIQGKLVEQRPEEGTGEELYRQIQAEKRRLIKEKKIKKEKPLPEIADDEIPFEIPESWKWVRLGHIGNTNIGLTYTPQDISQNGVIVLRSSNIQNEKIDYSDLIKVSIHVPKNKLCYKGDILICARNGSKNLVGKAAIIDRDGMSFGAFMAIFKSMCNNYIFYIICSAYFRNSLLKDTGTTTINQITQEMLKNVVIPLPPLAEQRRIVAKIEELSPYIDRYAAAWNRLEELNRKFPADMRKSLLQWAIQGKLVEQRPEEGTAEELYRKIQAEKRRLIEEKKIKKEKLLPEITDDEIPFDIPESWKWVRLGSISNSIGDGIHGTPQFSVDGDYYFINGNNLRNGKIIIRNNTQRVSEKEYKKFRSPLTLSSILISINGTVGNIAYYSGEKIILGKSACYIAFGNNIDKHYICILLMSKIFSEYALANATQTTIKNVSLKAIRCFPVPLPPLVEQRRIVARLEELLPLCEGME